MSRQVPDLIRARRLEKGWSLRALATELGISHVYLAECERGSRRLSARKALAIAALMGIDEREMVPAWYADRYAKHNEEMRLALREVEQALEAGVAPKRMY